MTNLTDIVKQNEHHIKYWIKRLNAPLNEYPDLMQVGILQILTDYKNLPPEEFHYKISFNIAKSLGQYLANNQGYCSLEYGKKENWKHRPVSYDEITETDENFMNTISFNIYQKPEDTKYQTIWDLIKPNLSQDEQELIKLCWLDEPKSKNYWNQTRSRKNRHLAKRSKENINEILKLAEKLKLTKCTQPYKVIETVRGTIRTKIALIINKLNIADIKITRNHNNRCKPFIDAKLYQEYA